MAKSVMMISQLMLKMILNRVFEKGETAIYAV